MVYTSNNSYMKRLTFFIPCLFLLTVYSFAQHSTKQMDHSGHLMLKTSDLKWVDAPPGLPAGAKLALLSGDPGKEGPFALRLQMPANYKVPPHFHPTAENVVVLEGTLYMGSGEKLDEATATPLAQGDYSIIPAKSPHWVFTKEPVTLHLYAEGPFAITYINSADDPRGAK
jgi:quercetin dioxygenase-like cupin family protein